MATEISSVRPLSRATDCLQTPVISSSPSSSSTSQNAAEAANLSSVRVVDTPRRPGRGMRALNAYSTPTPTMLPHQTPESPYSPSTTDALVTRWGVTFACSFAPVNLELPFLILYCHML